MTGYRARLPSRLHAPPPQKVRVAAMENRCGPLAMLECQPSPRDGAKQGGAERGMSPLRASTNWHASPCKGKSLHSQFPASIIPRSQGIRVKTGLPSNLPSAIEFRKPAFPGVTPGHNSSRRAWRTADKRLGHSWRSGTITSGVSRPPR